MSGRLWGVPTEEMIVRIEAAVTVRERRKDEDSKCNDGADAAIATELDVAVNMFQLYWKPDVQ